MKSLPKVLITLVALFTVADLVILNLHEISWSDDIGAIVFFLVGYLPFRIESLRSKMDQREPVFVGFSVPLVITNVVSIVLLFIDTGSYSSWEYHYWIGPCFWISLCLLGWILGLYSQDQKDEFHDAGSENDTE
jgi:uncharacterized membrane protein